MSHLRWESPHASPTWTFMDLEQVQLNCRVCTTAFHRGAPSDLQRGAIRGASRKPGTDDAGRGEEAPRVHSAEVDLSPDACAGESPPSPGNAFQNPADSRDLRSENRQTVNRGSHPSRSLQNKTAQRWSS
ncbi:hypothetical protein Q8A67_021904 [Cirrhinus molitorella]|uniref:Uncharacterized protein n=1 Tax=Cirrhinus molitorella TaxID=172907 RepID=A0AA88TEW0_9TELE|nr:hypothetical protein Q8A67_021904 [Cirrhinus molitorella]